MTDEHDEAVKALMRAFDERLAAAPLVDRRGTRTFNLIEASRSAGPVDHELAFWASPRDSQTPRRTEITAK